MTKEILLENARKLIVEMASDLDNIGDNLQRARKLYDFFLIADFIRQTDWSETQNEGKPPLEKAQTVNPVPEDLQKTKAKFQEIRESKPTQKPTKKDSSLENQIKFEERLDKKKKAEKNSKVESEKKNLSTDFISVNSFSVKKNKAEKPTKKELEPEKQNPQEETKTASVDKPRLSGGKINLNLNDRIAFINILFDGDREMFLESIQKLEEMEEELEATHYINHSIKPYYGNWEGKEDYEERFLEVVMFKFQ